MRSSTGASAVVVALALVLSGCASPQAPSKSPSETLQHWLRSVASADTDAFCGLSLGGNGPLVKESDECLLESSRVQELFGSADLSHAKVQDVSSIFSPEVRVTISQTAVRGTGPLPLGLFVVRGVETSDGPQWFVELP